MNQLLIEELSRRKLENPSYSLRSFALHLKLSPSALSEYLNGKRKISNNVAEHILGRLNLSFEKKIEWEKAHANRQSAGTYHQLSADQYRLIAEWEHYAILSLIRLKDFQPDHSWIAGRLGISSQEAEKACERLFRIGLLKKNSVGKWQRVSSNIKSSDGVSSQALRYSHLQNLDFAKEAVQNQGVDQRDVMAMTLAFDPKKMLKAKALIREFLEKFSEEMDSRQYSEVYKLCIQFFSITKTNDIGDKNL